MQRDFALTVCDPHIMQPHTIQSLTPGAPTQPLMAHQRARLRNHLIQAPTAELGAAVDVLQSKPSRPTTRPARRAIVVLGVPTRPNGAPSVGLTARVHRAAQAAHADPSALVVVSGGAVANRYSEADCMRAELIRAGVAPRRVLVEPHARTTLDNAAYTFLLLQSVWPDFMRAPSELTVVAEPFHLMRSLRLFAAAKEVFKVPASLRLAASLPGQSAALQPKIGSIRVGDVEVRVSARLLTGEPLARVQRCIEEKRRILCGW